MFQVTKAKLPKLAPFLDAAANAALKSSARDYDYDDQIAMVFRNIAGFTVLSAVADTGDVPMDPRTRTLKRALQGGNPIISAMLQACGLPINGDVNDSCDPPANPEPTIDFAQVIADAVAKGVAEGIAAAKQTV